MKKIGLIALALVLALGVMGGALAYWNETLTISGTVATGELDVEFSPCYSNDPPPNGEVGLWKPPTSEDVLGRMGSDAAGYYDPMCCGTWTFDPLVWTGEWKAFNVGATSCSLSKKELDPVEPTNDGDDLLTITMTNVYPSYCAHVAYDITNIGSIPAKIKSIKLVELSKGIEVIDIADVELDVCQSYCVDVETPSVTEQDSCAVCALTDDFCIHVTSLEKGVDIPVGESMNGDICIHVGEGVEEFPATYDFTIEIVVTQFNATP